MQIQKKDFIFDRPFIHKHKEMAPRTSQQIGKIRMEKKELILNTALELFAENGYHATSISQIAAKAEISKGLTYNYFKSKKEVLDEIIKHGFNSIFENFDLNHDGILTKDEFIYFIRQNFKFLRDNLTHWKLFFSLMLQPVVTDTFSKEYNEFFDPMFRMLFNFIEAQGSKDPEGDLIAISSMIEGSFLYAITVPEMFPIEILEEKIINACFKIIEG